MSLDPVATNPDNYTVVFENDRVRVLEYTDRPGDRTTPHLHPDSVMYTLSSFRRLLTTARQLTVVGARSTTATGSLRSPHSRPSAFANRCAGDSTSR